MENFKGDCRASRVSGSSSYTSRWYRILLIREFRAGARGVILHLPSGTLEPGENPKDCASRELEEETGYHPRSLEHLFQAYRAPSYSMELMHFFLATSLVRTGERRPEQDEIIKLEAVEPERAFRMIASNEIRDEKSISAISYLKAFGRLGGRTIQMGKSRNWG